MAGVENGRAYRLCGMGLSEVGSVSEGLRCSAAALFIGGAVWLFKWSRNQYL